jgi:hypothetical protein
MSDIFLEPNNVQRMWDTLLKSPVFPSNPESSIQQIEDIFRVNLTPFSIQRCTGITNAAQLEQANYAFVETILNFLKSKKDTYSHNTSSSPQKYKQVPGPVSEPPIDNLGFLPRPKWDSSSSGSSNNNSNESNTLFKKRVSNFTNDYVTPTPTPPSQLTESSSDMPIQNMDDTIKKMVEQRNYDVPPQMATCKSGDEGQPQISLKLNPPVEYANMTVPPFKEKHISWLDESGQSDIVSNNQLNKKLDTVIQLLQGLIDSQSQSQSQSQSNN